MTLDIAKFHRTCPIHPEHKRWFVVKDERGYFIDHNCPFGCSSSSSNAGSIANAIMDIATAEGITPSNKYEDDLLFGRTPTATRIDPNGLDPPSFWFGYDENGVRNTLGPLRAPWHPDKGQGFAFLVIYIGFLWDFQRRQVSLTEEKRLKFLRRVNDFRQKQVFSLYDLQKIHGSLCHIAYVYPLGRSYLAPLSNAIVAFNGRSDALHHHTTAMESATRWWADTLSSTCAFTSTPLQTGESGRTGDGKWDAFRSKPGWKSKLRHITWLEAIALELMVYTVATAGLKDIFLRVYSDNQGVIGAFAKGRSPNYEMNLAIRRMGLVLDAANITLDLVYVPSEENPADKLSRGVLGEPEDRSTHVFPIPSELVPYIYRV
ncbi:Reverse transcriptase/ribonuclease H [Mycena kentingensis (nom. inval.)]|nr:Reverse transcriptase/ribonuclease H [Mycena kentingensis (nom. inval.)]